jgi:hypothetical protein
LRGYAVSKPNAKYAYCGNCQKPKFTHVEGKCLFNTTNFRPMTNKERNDFITSHGLFAGTVTGRLSYAGVKPK